MKQFLSLLAILIAISFGAQAKSVTLDVSTDAGFQEITVEVPGENGADLLRAAQKVIEDTYKKDTEDYFIDVTVQTNKGFLHVTDSTKLNLADLKGTGSVVLSPRSSPARVVTVDNLPNK